MLEKLNSENQKTTQGTAPELEAENEIPSSLELHDDLDKEIEKCITSERILSKRSLVIDSLERFYNLTGKFFPEDPFYELRMQFFWDHFVFCTYWITSNKHEDLYSSSNEKIRETISDWQYSLFKIKKATPSQLTLVDLINNTKYVIDSRLNQSFDGLTKADFIQGFIYNHNGNWQLSRGLIIHPHKSRKAILKSLKTSHAGSVMDKLSQLALINLRHVRHAHVSPERIYSEIL